MRRLVSLMVSFCIIVSLCGTAFASESDQCLLNVQEGRLINLPNDRLEKAIQLILKVIQ